MNKVRNHVFWYLLGIEGCLGLEYFITSNFHVIEALFISLLYSFLLNRSSSCNSKS